MIILADIHGDIEILEAVLEKFPTEHYYFLGDLIDRGPENKKVLLKVRELLDAGKANLIIGNHEHMATSASWIQCWVMNGGSDVIDEFKSYGATSFSEAYTEFRKYLDPVIKYAKPFDIIVNNRGEKILLSHAAPPELENNKIIGEAHIWDRPGDSDIDFSSLANFSIHGHTPIMYPAMRHEHFAKTYSSNSYTKNPQSVYIDLGSFFSGQYAVYDTNTDIAHIYNKKDKTWKEYD